MPMDTTDHLAALEFARHNRLMHLATVEGAQPWCRLVSIATVEDDFTVWCATFASSNKVRQLKQNSALCFSAWAEPHTLQLFGHGEILRDSATRHAHWKPEWERYFPQGADDPEFVMLKASIERVEFS
jgi:general stress protein 26